MNWNSDTGFRAKTKLCFEFGLKIRFTPGTFYIVPHK